MGDNPKILKKTIKIWMVDSAIILITSPFSVLYNRQLLNIGDRKYYGIVDIADSILVE